MADKKLPPGIDQLPSGKFRYRYRDANRKMHSGVADTVTAAKRARTLALAAVHTGTHIDRHAGDQTVTAFARDEYAPAQDWSDNTREDVFPALLKRIEMVLPNNIALKDVDQLTIKRARVELQARYAPETVKKTMSYLVAIMRAAYVAGRIPRDPTIGAQSQRRRAHDDGGVTPDDVPTRDEVVAILEATPARFRAAVALGASGLRVGEVLGVSVDQVDLERHTVAVDRQMQRIGGVTRITPPKGGKSRTIQVPESVAVELAAHPRDLRAGGFLFPTPMSARLMRRDEFYKQVWHPALLAAGLEPRRYKFHSLRHFCASSMIAAGVPLPAVAGYLGDSLRTLTKVYAHWLRDDHDVPVAALDAILGRRLEVVSQECHDEASSDS